MVASANVLAYNKDRRFTATVDRNSIQINCAPFTFNFTDHINVMNGTITRTRENRRSQKQSRCP